jgi:molybdopterin synthase sulfur carrier subunit
MTVHLFGVTRDIIGKGSMTITAAEGIETVGDLKGFLREQYPALRELSSLALAVNHSYARDNDPVHESDEIALIPPVSGG